MRLSTAKIDEQKQIINYSSSLILCYLVKKYRGVFKRKERQKYETQLA